MAAVRCLLVALPLSDAIALQIFDGGITVWDDPQILGENPVLASLGRFPHENITKIIPVDANTPEWQRKTPLMSGTC